jgi:hypothetical protein
MDKCIDCQTPIGKKAKRCLSCSNKINSKKSSRFLGKVFSKKERDKIRKATSGKLNHFFGKRHKPESIKKMLETRTKTWYDSSNKPKQNKTEKNLECILNETCPNLYKFVGNWKFFIERFNPDFISVDGSKRIIELFGDYWHNLEYKKIRDKKRLLKYSEYGYKTLVVWENELKDVNVLKNKIQNFNNT